MKRYAFAATALLALALLPYLAGESPVEPPRAGPTAQPPLPDPLAGAAVAHPDPVAGLYRFSMEGRRVHDDDADVAALVRRGMRRVEEGDYYAAAEHLAAAHEARPDLFEICIPLARAYDQLHLTHDALAVRPCLAAAAASGSRPAAVLLERLERAALELEFQVAVSDHFMVSHPKHGAAAESVGRVLELLESARDSIGARTGLVAQRRIPVVIYPEREFALATGDPHGALGIYDGKIRFALERTNHSPELLETMLAHEYVHALLHDYTGVRVPPWLNEGLAVYLSEPGYDRRKLVRLLDESEAALDHETLSRSFRGLPPEKVKLAYHQSYWMTRDLIEEYGWHRIDALLGELRASPNAGFETAFRAQYREAPDAYLGRWSGQFF